MNERIRNLEDRMSDIERTQRHINEKVRREVKEIMSERY
jgi:hypothetical protein